MTGLPEKRYGEARMQQKINSTYPRFLSKNEKCESPNEFIAVDTESFIEKGSSYDKHTLRLGEAIYCYKRLGIWHDIDFSFNTKEEFYSFLDRYVRKGTTIRVIAHNMAYDANLLDIDKYMTSREMVIEQWVLEPFIVKAFSENGSIKFLSSTNWFRRSLRDIGKAFGVEKMESPIFGNDVPDNVLRPYCHQDTKVLAEIIKGYTKWLRDNDLGNFADTISAQAFNAYRHKWMSEHSILLHRYPHVEAIERESYLGGRCECFHIGKIKNVYKLDINSMYPYVMKYKTFPCKLISGENFVNEHVIYDAIDSGKYIIAKCKINLKENSIGIRRDKLLFPIGKVITSLSSPEINYILENPEIGEIEKIIGGSIYDHEKLFSEYVDFFYKIKSTSKVESEIAMAKALLVSLYGKFGQREYLDMKEEKDTDAVKAMIETGITSIDEILDKDRKLINIGGKIYRLPEKSENSSVNANPAIAGGVTAYARCYLDSLIRLAGRENVYYTDTDSLFCNETGMQNLTKYIDEKELGKLKMEEWIKKSGIYCTDIEIFGAKNYGFLDTIKIKGIRKDALKIGENRYIQDQFCTKKSHYSERHEPGSVIVKHVIKEISNEYDKGLVTRTGKVLPFVFSEY